MTDIPSENQIKELQEFHKNHYINGAATEDKIKTNLN